MEESDTDKNYLKNLQQECSRRESLDFYLRTNCWFKRKFNEIDLVTILYWNDGIPIHWKLRILWWYKNRWKWTDSEFEIDVELEMKEGVEGLEVI